MPKEALRSLTEPMYYVLLALTEPLCGIEIMARVKELSRGRVVIGPGTLYTMLAKFDENSMIVPVYNVLSESRKKSYIITDKGIEMLKQEFERMKHCMDDGRSIMEGKL